MSGRTTHNDEPSKVTTQTGTSTPTVNSSSLSGFALPTKKLIQHKANNNNNDVHERIDRVVPNLRDISISAEMKDMKPGLLYRAARPFSTSFVAVSEVYKDLLRIHTIIDLRDDDLTAIPEELTARATLSHFYEPFSVTATRPAKSPIPVHSAPPSPIGTLEAKPSATTIDEPPDAFEDPPPPRSKTHKFIAKTATKAQRTVSHRPRTVVDAEGFPLRDSYMAKIRSRRPELAPDIVQELVSDPQMRPVCDLIANVDPNLPKMLIVNIFDTPEFKKRVMETVTASPYLPMIAMAKVTDKLTGSAYAPFYFCKYIISAHDLYDSYVEMLQCCGTNFALAMKLVALATRPVLFHCSLGKDRTGLLSMLILSVLGAHPSGIIFDFTLTAMQTNEEFRAYIQKFVVEYSGLPEGFGGASVEAIGRTLDYLRSNHGSVSAYLDSIGFTAPWRALLRSRYLSSPAAS